MLNWHGHWALVTGSSSGIGREFAVQLAAAGMNLVLVARRKDRLDALASSLQSAHQVQCAVIPSDLSQPGAAVAIREQVETRGAKVRLLVNNAAEGRWGRFERTDGDVYARLVQLDNTAVVALCREFFDQLRSFSGAAVINVSSQAALQPMPFMAVYGASKAFVQSFSLALYEEWKKYGIHVQTLIPGPTETEFDGKAGAYASTVSQRGSAADVVKASLSQLGRDRPVVSSVGGIGRQRLLSGIIPPKRMVKEVAKMFRPPDER